MSPLFKHISIRLKKESLRWRVLFLVALIALTGFCLLPTQSLFAQNLESMPWVDQENGEVSPVGVSEREAAATRDRSSIPVAPTRKKKAPIANAGPVNTGPSVFSGLGAVILYSCLAIGAVALVGLFVWIIMNSRIDLEAGPEETERPDRSLAESIRHLPFEMDVTKGDFRQQAHTSYQSGDFRGALIFLFSHVLVTLDQAKLVRLKKGKTNRQYLRELSPSPPLVGYYGDVMVPFEQTFFGDYPITKDAFEKCWRGLDDFQSTVKTARARATRQGQGTHA